MTSAWTQTVIIKKARQLYLANKAGKKFFEAYRNTRDPLELFNKKADFSGAPAYEVYLAGTEELAYHLKNNPVTVPAKPKANNSASGNTDHFARTNVTKISGTGFESVRVVLERAVGAQALSLEKGMIILSTAVAGGPFIGLQNGDTGVRSVESVTMLGIDVGLFTLVLVKPLCQMSIRGIDAPVEIDLLKDFSQCPQVQDDAYLNFIVHPGGTLAAAPIHGYAKFVWK